jgi:energy-coupling factor transporter ATP-binding protein EcfA2
MVDITLRRGNRGFITGTSGSGKTTLALALAEAMPAPLVVVDTKWDPNLLTWAKRNKIKIWTKTDPPKWQAIKEDILIRFRASWLSHPEDIDWWLGQAFYCPYVPSIYIDEGYQVGATSRKMGEGVSGLWTRGRVFGFVTLIGAQRPVEISKFVVTESDKLYIGSLQTKADRLTIEAMTGEPDARIRLPKRSFLFIDRDENICATLKPLDLGKQGGYSREERYLTRKKMVRIK